MTMPYIFVRNSMNMEIVPNLSDVTDFCRVAEEAYSNTRTYIDSRFQWTEDQNRALERALGPLTRPNDENRRDSLLSSPRPPFEVLDKLQTLGFSVVAANTVRVTTVWTLYGILTC